MVPSNPPDDRYHSVPFWLLSRTRGCQSFISNIGLGSRRDGHIRTRNDEYHEEVNLSFGDNHADNRD